LVLPGNGGCASRGRTHGVHAHAHGRRRYFAAKVEKAPGWRLVKMPVSHDVMVDMPKELAAELLKLV
jgi:hypothetical protein